MEVYDCLYLGHVPLPEPITVGWGDGIWLTKPVIALASGVGGELKYHDPGFHQDNME